MSALALLCDDILPLTLYYSVLDVGRLGRLGFLCPAMVS